MESVIYIIHIVTFTHIQSHLSLSSRPYIQCHLLSSSTWYFPCYRKLEYWNLPLLLISNTLKYLEIIHLNLTCHDSITHYFVLQYFNLFAKIDVFSGKKIFFKSSYMANFQKLDIAILQK